MTLTIIRFIDVLFQIFSFLILVDVIGSWVMAGGVRLPVWGTELLRAVRSLTAPVLDPIRRILPNLGGLDFSPLVALLLLELLRNALMSIL